MLIALFGQSVALVIFAFSPSPWLDYLAFIGLTIMGSVYRPASMAMVADLVPAEERRDVFALFYGSVNFGVIFGPVLGAIFFFDYRRELLLTSAVTVFLLFLVMLKVLRETLPPSLQNSKSSTVKDQIKNYRIIFTDKVFFLYILAGVLVSQTFMQIDLYLAVYIRSFVPEQTLNLGLWSFNLTPEKLYGWLISENGLLVVLFTVAVTRLIRKWSDEKALILSSILFGLSFWLMAFTMNVWYLIILMAIFTLAELIRTPVIQNFITEIAPEEQRGQYLGASSLQYSIGRAIAPLAVTFAAYFDPITITSAILALSLIAAVLYKWMFHIYRKQQPVGNNSSVS